MAVIALDEQGNVIYSDETNNNRSRPLPETSLGVFENGNVARMAAELPSSVGNQGETSTVLELRRFKSRPRCVGSGSPCSVLSPYPKPDVQS